MAEIILDKEQIGRLERMVDRVVANFTPEYRESVTKQDGRLQNLFKDYVNATEQHQFTRVAVITRQMKARTEDLLCNHASKIIKEACLTGDIILYMDDDQRERYNLIRGRIFLAMGVLDAALSDMTGVLHANGLQGTVTMLHEIRAAREAIDKWGETIPVLKTEAAEIAGEECDRCYDYLSKRTEMLNKKANRLLLKNESLASTPS